MSDERPAGQEAIWEQLRAVEPPPEARGRVYRALREEEEARRRRRARGVWLAVPAAAVAAAVIAIALGAGGGAGGGGDREAARPRAIAAEGARQGGRAIGAGDAIDGRPVRVEGALRVALEQANVEIAGPAMVELSSERVVLRAGRLEVDGEVDVEGPACRARIRGRGRVELRQAALHVTVLAGTAEIVPPRTSCVVIELREPRPITAAAEPRTAEPEAAVPEAAVPEAAVPEAAVPEAVEAKAAPSELALQTEAYWAAQRVRERDPAAALAQLRALARRWPRTPIRHEIDLAIVDLLVRLGRAAEAERAARAFLRAHPASERAADVRAIAGGDRD